ncbi:MAG: hypothetical protein GY762_13880 [Proteobacteria bacterium]|nr:hypothetical protein [Pseudomonadota bacterium]
MKHHALVFFLITACCYTEQSGAVERENRQQSRTIRFAWTPPDGPRSVYHMDEPEDQHRIVLFPGVGRGDKVPVVVAFHGQPGRGRNPRQYPFPGRVEKQIAQLIETGRIRPVVLVVPVFRFVVQNWPRFDVAAFRKKVEAVLRAEGIEATFFLAFGYSGAAGCGGDGLNRAHRMRPKAVGFFDTCLGKGWQEEIGRLRDKGIPALNIHSVETAGFRPKQRPEYQEWFDFGRAYAPLGLAPVPCPENHPGEKLREQVYRCAATADGVVEGFVVDTGEGLDAHRGALSVGTGYFLKKYLGSGK